MGRAGRLAVVFLGLVAALALLGWWLGLAHAGQLAAAALFVLAALAGLWLRGRRPGFTRAERRQVFGRLHD